MINARKPNHAHWTVWLLAVLLVTLLDGCGAGWDQRNNVSDAINRDRDLAVRENMRTMQIAVEKYAGNHGGDNYPAQMSDELKTYFPGGIAGKVESPIGPVNPFTGLNEFPTIARIVKNVEQARHGKRFEIPPGKIYYCALDGGRSYAIVGGAHDGKALLDVNNPDEVLVFSNI